MFLQTSLRAQILALLGDSLALILVTALACFSFLSNGMQAYQGLLSGPLEKSARIDAANLNFKPRCRNGRMSCCAAAIKPNSINFGASSKHRNARFKIYWGN